MLASLERGVRRPGRNRRRRHLMGLHRLAHLGLEHLRTPDLLRRNPRRRREQRRPRGCAGASSMRLFVLVSADGRLSKSQLCCQGPSSAPVESCRRRSGSFRAVVCALQVFICLAQLPGHRAQMTPPPPAPWPGWKSGNPDGRGHTACGAASASWSGRRPSSCGTACAVRLYGHAWVCADCSMVTSS
jgi:hypothetical protein